MKSLFKLSVISTAIFCFSALAGENSKISEGINYYKNGNYEKAAAKFEEVLKTDPNNPAALSNLGFIYYRMGKLQRAKEYLIKSLKYIKDKELIAMTYHVLAEIEKKNNNEEGYYKNLLQAVNYNPNLTDAVSDLIDYLYSKNDVEKIASLNVDIKKLNENQQLIVAESYIKTGKNIDEAKNILEKLKTSKNNKVSSSAVSLLASIQPKEKEPVIKTLAKENEVSLEKVKFKKSVSTTVEKDISKQIQQISKPSQIKKIAENERNISTNEVFLENEQDILNKINTNPSPELFNKAGLILMKQGKFEEAKDKFLQALRIDPFNADALNNLGILYFNLKDYDKSIKYFSEAIKRNSSFADAYYNLGNTYYKLGELYRNISYFQNAIENYRKVVSLNPNHKSAYYNMANAYFMIEDYKTAIEYYKKADMTNIKTLKNIALSYYNLAIMEDHKDSAVEYLKEAIKYDKTLKEAYYMLGKIVYEKGDYEQAKRYLKEAYNLYSDKAEIVYLLGLAYSYSGDKDTAIKYYKELRDMNQSLADKLFETLF